MAGLKIYTDENVAVHIAEGLKKRGIKAFSAIEQGMTGVADTEHFECASEMQAVIFTHDHHFIEISDTSVKEGKNHYLTGFQNKIYIMKKKNHEN